MRRPLVHWLIAFATLTGAPTVRAQGAAPPPPAADLIHPHAERVRVTAGATASVPIRLDIQSGWHVNANPPAAEEMIPTTVEVAAAPGFTPDAARYPAGQRRKLSFADEELLVYDGSVTTLRVPVTVASGATPGAHVLHAKLRYQACNDQLCLAPVTIPFDLTIEVIASAPGAAAATGSGAGSTARASADTGTTPIPGAGFVSAPPAGGGATSAVPSNPITRLFERGSFLAFLGLFLIGLALNLTPCVYPMLGVTVSIFGTRASASPLRAFGLASVYVLGMAAMYSALGVAAALTGTLFGSWLSNPWVLLAFAALMAALALSMFGLYELNPPYWLLSRLGGSGATSVAGVFLSGLVVGVFAAPCTGPPVVALLALVGAKGDPVFGFTAFFTLALGLGAPYLVLGTFSNLLQRLPRSGVWMVWVKKAFGTLMLGLSLYFVTVAVRPGLLPWVIPAAAIVAGVYLGFLERSVTLPAFRRLQWLAGALAIVTGVTMLLAAPRPARALVFEPLAAGALERVAASDRPLILDFSADWCIPCHELEIRTFTDASVIAKGKEFRRVRVDLTRYDSEESQRARERFGIRGVPTIVFLTPDGREVRAARVEGFLPPARFIERMDLALAEGRRAQR
jgi:thiol:disulfide interchange protein DsbD